MIIYLAGGVTGNLIAEWKAYAELMKIYLAGLNGEKNRIGKALLDENMKIFLAETLFDAERFKRKDINVLESYFYIQDKEWMYPLIKQFKGFMLDSGSFV